MQLFKTSLSKIWFSINEGSISFNNREFMHSNVNESGIVASSVLRNIVVQDLVNHGL